MCGVLCSTVDIQSVDMVPASCSPDIIVFLLRFSFLISSFFSPPPFLFLISFFYSLSISLFPDFVKVLYCAAVSVENIKILKFSNGNVKSLVAAANRSNYSDFYLYPEGKRFKKNIVLRHRTTWSIYVI